MLFDSHCHLTADAFAEDRDEVVSRAREAGVERLVTVASTPADTLVGLDLALRHEGIWTTAGFHPHEASRAHEESRAHRASNVHEASNPSEGWLAEVEELLGRDRVVAVGECGLDYHYDHSPRAVQRAVFEGHVELAAASGLPLVVHSRSADEDMAAVLRSVPAGVGGVLHCFTGSDALLETALDAGFHVSFTGLVTFGSYGAAHQVRAVPADRLMVETDSPYLAPVPHRGRRNEPAYVRKVAEAVAAIRGETVEEVARSTTAVAERFYGVGGSP